MAYQLTILPIIVHPQKDELFSSWLFRLATSNYSKAHTFCKFHFPGYSIWNRDIDRIVPDVMIRRLELLTEVPYQNIYQLTLRSYEKNVFELPNSKTKQKWVLALGIYHRSWKEFGLQFCPGCLSKDKIPYFRKSWRLGTSVVCTNCQLLLHDRCPNCSAPLTFFRNDIGFKYSITPKQVTNCFKCDFDLKLSPRYPSMIGTIGFQSKINSTISSNQWGIYKASEYFEVLYNIIRMLKSKSKLFYSFKETIMDCEDLRIKSLPEGRDFETLNTFEREHLVRISSWILDDWPDRLISLCKDIKLDASAIIGESKSLPPWFRIEVKNHLHKPSVIELNPIPKKKKRY